jgi:hypothetical protein
MERWNRRGDRKLKKDKEKKRQKRREKRVPEEKERQKRKRARKREPEKRDGKTETRIIVVYAILNPPPPSPGAASKALKGAQA